MAVSTTQSIWRSGGGDQTRTAYCGSGVMAAQFYIADAGPAATANVKVSSAANAPDLILPAGAVVTSIVVSAADTPVGSFDLGYAAMDGSPANTDGLLSNAGAGVDTFVVGGTGAGADLGLVMSATELVNITVTDNTSAGGSLTGFILYYVADPLAGQQSA